MDPASKMSKPSGVSGFFSALFDPLFSALRLRAEVRFFRWVDKHTPADNRHLLTRKKLYIFPSWRGIGFIGVVLLLWLLGTNYQNNPILGLSFLLTSILVVAILRTHANLSGLDITYVGAGQAHAGSEVDFHFKLTSSSGRFVENLEAKWQRSEQRLIHIDVPPAEMVTISVPLFAPQRGWLKPGRLLLESHFPLGILRCWTWLVWDAQALIYPRLVETDKPSQGGGEGEDEGFHPLRGGDDFSGLREFRAGDSLKHIAWKVYARERGLYVKEFGQNLSRELWLSLDLLPTSNLEEGLSMLSYLAVALHREDEFYGLRLPGVTLAPNRGEDHKRKVLEHLALFGLGDGVP